MADVATPATDVRRLVTHPSGWGRVRLYGASAAAGHIRRRVDTITLVLYVVALAVVIPAASTTDGVEAALADVVESLPTAVDPFAALPYDLLAVWAVAMVGAALVRRHWRLALSLITAIPVAACVTLVVNNALGLEGDAAELTLGAPQAGVPIQLVMSLGVASIAARELSRPFRTTTHRLAVAAVLGAFLLPVASPYRILCGVLAAGVTAGLMRVAFGTPRTTVSAADVRLGLQDLGVETEPVSQWPDAAGAVTGIDGAPLLVRTLGRDEWESQLTVTFWRFLWYRNSGDGLRRSPRLQLEHQALLLLLAEQHDVGVTPVVAVGMSRLGDAILATRLDGAELPDLRGRPDRRRPARRDLGGAGRAARRRHRARRARSDRHPHRRCRHRPAGVLRAGRDRVEDRPDPCRSGPAVGDHGPRGRSRAGHRRRAACPRGRARRLHTARRPPPTRRLR